MFRFEELQIWRRAVEYGKDCYKVSEKFPRHEQYSLGDQLRRAGISISSNIAEGSVGSAVNFKRYLVIAIGSTLETVNLINFACEVGYVSLEMKEAMYEKAENLAKMIRGFLKSLK